MTVANGVCVIWPFITLFNKIFIKGVIKEMTQWCEVSHQGGLIVNCIIHVWLTWSNINSTAGIGAKCNGATHFLNTQCIIIK